MSDHRDPFRDWDAAYVLGSLGPEDRRAYERHLSACAECSAAVAELAGMPGLLGWLGREDAVALLDTPVSEPTAPEAGTRGMVRPLAIAAGRKRRRARGMAAVLSAVAGVAVLAVGVLLGTWIDVPATDLGSPSAVGSTSAGTIAMEPIREGTITAELSIAEKAWGTRFDWSCEYLDDRWSERGSPPAYDLVVTDASGTERTVATWTAAGSRAGGLTASSSVRTSDIRAVEIRVSGSGTPLARAEL